MYTLLWTVLSASLFLPGLLQAQHAEQLSADTQADTTLSFGWELRGGAGTAGSLPFWLHSNQQGQIDPRSANSTLSLFTSGEHSFGSGISVAAKADVLVRGAERSALYVQEGFVKLSYADVMLWAGRKQERFGLVQHRLSTGSMDISQNARPVPQIVFATRGFIPVPFSRGVLHADASLGHGWMTDSSYRFVEDTVRLHRKHLYLRFFSEEAPLAIYAGLKHFAQWGGSSPIHGESPVNFSSFMDVFFSRASDSNEILGGGELLNSAQNHIGSYDVALSSSTSRYRFSLSRQFILEDTPNARFGTPFDGLWGASITRRAPGATTQWRDDRNSRQRSSEPASRLHSRPSPAAFRPLLKTIHYEYLDLKEGMSRYPNRPRDEYFNYYNHYAYRGGWTYHNQSIGNPLLFTNPDYFGVVNNELIAHHAAFRGYAGPMEWRLLATYSRNYGANRVSRTDDGISRENLLTDRRDQWSFLLDLRSNRLFEAFETGIQIGFDTGEVHRQNLGAMLSLRWTSGL